MPEIKPSETLLLKAEQDEYILDKCLDDPKAPVEIFGFHAQQAAEKLLKAILLISGADYPQIHRLADLLDLAKARGIVLPKKFEELRHLTPYAVEYRYEALPEEPETPLDKKKVRQALKDLREWVEAFAVSKKE